VLETMLANLSSFKQNGSRHGFRYDPTTLKLSMQLLVKSGRGQYALLSDLFCLPRHTTLLRYKQIVETTDRICCGTIESMSMLAAQHQWDQTSRMCCLAFDSMTIRDGLVFTAEGMLQSHVLPWWHPRPQL
jgi:hypothetical protein